MGGQVHVINNGFQRQLGGGGAKHKYFSAFSVPRFFEISPNGKVAVCAADSYYYYHYYLEKNARNKLN